MSGSFGEAFLASPHGPRVVALEVPRGYRDARGEERPVTLSRYDRCRSCAKKGCEICSFAGWTIAESSVQVIVPPGATPGTRLAIEGASDVVVEVVEPGPRADELRAAAADYEAKLLSAWEMDRSTRRRGRHRLRLAAGAALALLAIVAAGSWLSKPGAGEPCKASAQCRSGQCIRLLTRDKSTGLSRLDAQVCTTPCETDLDCPQAMRCRAPGSAPSVSYAADAPPGLSCIPQGY